MRRWGAGLATLLVAGAVAGGVIISGDQDPPATGFPGAANTGVPDGTSLTTHSGVLTVSSTSQAVSAMNVTGCIVVQAHSVTIDDSAAKCIVVEGAAANTANPPLTVTDTTLDCDYTGPGDDDSSGLDGSNFEAYRVDISGCENGLNMGTDVVLEDSWLHGMTQCASVPCTEPDLHTDGIQSPNGSNTTINHNTITAVNPPCSITTGTAQAAGNTITYPGHGLAVGDTTGVDEAADVQLYDLVGGSGLSENTYYHLVGSTTADTFQVATSDGAAPVDITGDYSSIWVVKSDGRCNGTAAININNSGGGPTTTNTTISNNLLSGGAVTILCPVPTTSNFNITGNEFTSEPFSPEIGWVGPSLDCATNENKSGNVYHESGDPITLG